MAQVNKKVLLVEDEPAIRKILSIKLRVSGYDVIIAQDGEEALRLAGRAAPDIVLLDILLPILNGFQVLEQLRSRSALPVVAFSAKPENAQRAMSLGANDFLSKPFDVDDLLVRIERALDHRK